MKHSIEVQPGDALKKSGKIRIWRVDPKSGRRELVVSKKNMILNQGADLLAKALAGEPYAAISHMYIGYKNTTSFTYPDDAPTIDKIYSIPFSAYGSSGTYEDFGYLRLPLAYTPSFLEQEGYNGNVALFTSIIASSDNDHGAAFTSTEASHGGHPPSQIFEVALVAALDPTSQSQDMIFSRANFNALEYNPSFNLTTTWGVQFLA